MDLNLQQQGLACAAAGDKEPIHVEEADAESLRRGRSIDQGDALRALTGTISGVNSSLLSALNRHNKRTLDQKIVALYAIKQRCVESGNSTSVARYDRMIEKLEEKLEQEWTGDDATD